MDINVKKLRDALQMGALAVGRGKSAPPVTKYAMLGAGELRTTNREVHIQVALPEAAGDPMLIPQRETLEMLNFAPGGQNASLRIRRKKLEIKVGSSSMTVATPESTGFPELPQVSGEAISIDGDLFLSAFRQVAPYAAADNDRPILAGIVLRPEDDGENTRLIGADGYRLAFQRLPGVVLECEVVVPKTTVSILDKLWKKADKVPMGKAGNANGLTKGPTMDIARAVVAKRALPVAIDGTERFIRFVAGQFTLTSELVPGNYPKVESLIPKDLDVQVVVDGGAMYRAVQQIAPIASGGANIVRLEWDRVMTLSGADGEGQSIAVEVPLQGSNAGGHIAFNLRYISDFLKDKDGPVMIEITTESSPSLFTYRGHSGVVIMPMFVDWDAKGKKGRAAGDQAPAEPAAEGEDGPNQEEKEVTE